MNQQGVVTLATTVIIFFVALTLRLEESLAIGRILPTAQGRQDGQRFVAGLERADIVRFSFQQNETSVAHQDSSVKAPRVFTGG